MHKVIRYPNQYRAAPEQANPEWKCTCKIEEKNV